MKYMVSGMKPVVVKKPFDFEAAYESLEKSLHKASEAYAALVSAEAAVADFEQCLRDGKSALESIKKWGITPQNMQLINEGNQLDKALGLEHLDLAAIESLSESTKKLLQGNYCSGLEALEAENKKSFVQAIKELFKKVLEFLKERFMGLSRITKILENTKIEGEFDGEKTISSVSYDTCKSLLESVPKAIDNLNKLAAAGGASAADFAKVVETGVQAGSYDDFSGLEKKEDAARALGWDAGKVEDLRKKFVEASKKTASEMDAAWKKIQAEFKKVEGGDANDQSVMEKIKLWRRATTIANKYSGFITKCLQMVGLSILNASKAVKKAAPAEPAPAK